MTFVPSTNIPKHYLNAFFATQFLLIGLFYSQLTYVVSTSIIIILFYIGLTYLCYITKYMSCIGCGIMPHRSLLNRKTFEFEHLFLQIREFACRYLTDKQLGCITGVPWI